MLPFRITWFLLGTLLLGLPVNLPAQQATAVRAYQTNAADEDWSFLSDRSKRSDIWDPLKYIPLGADNRYLTLNGEIRYRSEGFRVHGIAGASSLSDAYILQRYLLGANVKLSRRFRLFTEIQSGIISGNLNSPRPTDKNPIDLHQAFFEWRQPLNGKREIGLKVGRQELSIGSSRLISASPGLNVKRSFDGGILYYLGDSWRFHGAFAKLVSLKPHRFDDTPDPKQTFLGFAASRKSPRFKHGELGFYYLYVDRKNAEYDQGKGRDQRQTAGVKWSGRGERADLNYDAIFQWGSFNGYAVLAWAFSTETGYRLLTAPGKPRFSLRADIASGDRDPVDPRLQSFNPLFPGNSYSGIVGLLGPTNLTDFTPAITFTMAKRLVLGLEVPIYWRTSTADGIYSIDLRVIIPANTGQGRYVGTNPGFIVSWQATRHLMLQGVVTRFFSGKFLDRTFVANGFAFCSASMQYRF